MKTKTIAKTLVLIAITAGAGWLLAGCGSTKGYKQADKTGEGIASFREEILKGKKAIDQTMASLDAITTSATIDPRPAFELYSKNVGNLESTANKIRKRGQDMKEQGQAYFAQWEQELAQVKNPEIQKLASNRKAKLQAAFDKIKQTTEPLKEKFDPWMSDLKDLQTVLANDLTINGIDAARGLVGKARGEGQEIQKSMDALVDELNRIAATLTAAKVEPQPAQAK